MAIKKLHDVLSRLIITEAFGVFPLPDTMQLCNAGYVTKQAGVPPASQAVIMIFDVAKL